MWKERRKLSYGIEIIRYIGSCDKNLSCKLHQDRICWRQSSFKYGYPGFILGWHFETTNVQVYEEYLIYDEIGMIGSIGGLLGLFLGFSFLNVISYCIGKIQKMGRSQQIMIIWSGSHI